MGFTKRMGSGLSFPFFILAVVVGALLFSVPSSAAVTKYDVSFELPAFSQGQYHRPYVAIWVEDSRHKAVRSVLLWQKKKKWLKDLSRYWRRVARSNDALVDSLTGATHGPDTYDVSWDGLDEQGHAVAAGEYSLCAEVAREGGGREAVCLPFAIGPQSVDEQMVGKHELLSLSLRTQ